MIRLGEQTRRLLLMVAMHDEEDEEALSAAEWEACFTIIGLQVAFRGNLPAAVAEECFNTIAEVGRRTGLPVHIVGGQQGPEQRR